MNWQNAFFESLGRVKSDPLVTVSLQSHSSDIKNGYAYVERTHAHKYKISLFRGGSTYKRLFLYLLHEYGHVLDEERYYGSERQRLYNLYEYPDVALAPLVCLAGKRAILHTEYLAETTMPILAKRWGFYSKELEKEMKIGCMLEMLSRKYEFTFGKKLSSEFSGIIKRSLKSNISSIKLGSHIWKNVEFDF